MKPYVFPLAPAGEYRHRLVLDLYPETPRDPLLALVQPRPDPIGEIARAPVLESPPGSPASPVVEAAAPGTLPVVRLEPGKGAPAKPAKAPAPVVDRMVTIVIDAGHGGEDPGARGRRGTLREGRDARHRPAPEGAHRPGAGHARGAHARRRLLHRRSRSACRRRGACRPTSSSPCTPTPSCSPHARGSSVFALSERGATSAAARWLAKRENESDLIGGVNLDVKDPVLARTLLDLSQTATINDSLKLGKAVLGELGDINHLHKAAVEQAGFAVLKAPDIPSILVETAFISNPDEEKRLKDAGLPGQDGRRDLPGHQALPRAEPAACPRAPRPEPLRRRPQAVARPPGPLACARSIAEASSAVRGFEKR